MDRPLVSSSSSSSSSSAIDSLIFDSIINDTTEMDIEANLDLWANTQFKYDSISALHDSVKPSPAMTVVSTVNSLPATSTLFDGSSTNSDHNTEIPYGDLAKYLDLDFPQQEQQQAFTPQQQPVKSVPRQQLLLPKIDHNTTLEDVTKLLILSSDTDKTTFLLPQASTAVTKQNHTAHTGTSNVQRPSKTAAEEEKRRRNTAASARFRVKKKLKEKAMEQTVRDMTEKSNKLENRVRELESEIKFLRALLIEKNRSEQNSSATEGQSIAAN